MQQAIKQKEHQPENLPAAGEIYRICQNKSILNTALLKIGGTALPDGYHWSSSENSFTDGIYLDFKNGKYFNTGNVQYTKANEYIVRPVIAFPVSAAEEPDTTPTPDYSNCTVGAILYSDKTCSADLIEGKKAIGVVLSSGKKLAIALKTAALKWSTTNFDIPLLGGDENDADGQYNTRVVLEYCRANDRVCPAFEYAASYQTEGTSAGDWYLPAIGELNDIYKNKDVLNETLGKIGGTKLPSDEHWSSSESSIVNAWVLRFRDGYVHHGIKYDYYDVRPVLAF